MDTNSHPRPTSHYDIRALLRVIERGYSQNDIEALYDACDLADALSPEYYEDLQTYINGLIENINHNERSYRMYSDDDINHAKEALYKLAYGDFDEAMMTLEYDLRGIDIHRDEAEMESLVFRPELFNDADRKKWNELWAIAQLCLDAPGDSEENGVLAGAIASLRSYQQKSHGALVPTMTATYRKGNEGVGVRIAWFDECLHVLTHAPFYKELDEFFINTAPVDGIVDFTPGCFPKHIDGYELGGVSSENLFQYEL